MNRLRNYGVVLVALIMCMLMVNTSHAAGTGEYDIVIANESIQQTNTVAGTNFFMGKVGIGTDEPTDQLHVDGSVKVTEGLTVDGALTVPKQGDVSMGTYTNGTASGGSEAVLGVSPIGTVQAWCKNIGTNALALPAGWMECDGSTVSNAASPLDGLTIPDLNGGNSFLRGNSTSGGFGGESTVQLSSNNIPAHAHSFHIKSTAGIGGNVTYMRRGNSTTAIETNADTFNAGLANPVPIENKPPYFNIVWIIRYR